MDEVTFDKMIHTEYERHLAIEKEYLRYKPVRDERSVLKSYRSVKIDKGKYKTLLQWEAQAAGQYGDRSLYTEKWLAGTVKVLVYREKKARAAVLSVIFVFAPLFLIFLTAAAVLFLLDFPLIGIAGIAAALLCVLFFRRKLRAALNKRLFYSEFARILGDLTKNQ